MSASLMGGTRKHGDSARNTGLPWAREMTRLLADGVST